MTVTLSCGHDVSSFSQAQQRCLECPAGAEAQQEDVPVGYMRPVGGHARYPVMKVVKGRALVQVAGGAVRDIAVTDPKYQFYLQEEAPVEPA